MQGLILACEGIGYTLGPPVGSLLATVRHNCCFMIAVFAFQPCVAKDIANIWVDMGCHKNVISYYTMSSLCIHNNADMA